jgi:hypothetical protein
LKKWLALAFVAMALTSHAADSARNADDAYLDELQGKWSMEGTMGKEAVHYFADGQRVLKNGFLKFHMIDGASPPQYQADVFIGFDRKANDYIAHWLDQFGAAGARVVARGERHGAQLVLIFPYADGAFRDTFTWRPESTSWTLLLENQHADGTWATFANYTLTRAPKH